MQRIKVCTWLQVGLLSSLLSLGLPAWSVGVDEEGLFELDGNALESGSPGDDWETLYLNPASGAQEVFTFATEPDNYTVFDGGKKDIQDITQWSWGKYGNGPDKNDITNAYAAAYNNPGGELIVYFGADRITNEGDAFFGWWFFVNEVGLDPDPGDPADPDPSGGDFIGSHTSVVWTDDSPANGRLDAGEIITAGDLLTVVEFPQANNAVPYVEIVMWDNSCSKATSNNPVEGECAAKNLRLLYKRAAMDSGGTGVVCGTEPNLPVCAITNAEGGPNDPTDAPWPYIAKDGTDGMFPYETFFEGGINLSQLLGTESCFASFMAETRSSRSFTATLKDFVLGSFPLCGFEISKSCEADLNATDDVATISFSGEVENTGVSSLEVDLEDITAGGNGTFTAFCIDDGDDECGGAGDTPVTNTGTATVATIIVPGGTNVRYEGYYTVNNPDLTDLNFSDEVQATAYSLVGTPIGDPKSDTANCFAPNPTIDVTKNCDASLTGGDTFQGILSGLITNTGNVTLEDITLIDIATDGSGLVPASFDAWYDDGDGIKEVGEASFTLGVDDLVVDGQVGYSGTVTSNAVTSHSDQVTASGDYYAGGQVEETASDIATASCSLILSQDIDLTKACKDGADDGVSLFITATNEVAVRITNEIVVTNPATADPDRENLNILLTDTKADSLTIISKPLGSDVACGATNCTGVMKVGDVVKVKATYVPSSIDAGSLVAQETATFSNTANVAATGVLSGSPVSDNDTADCTLCN
ncbi:hypothetical protein ACFVYJ_08040 [Pontibacter sp. JAM-7]|uniref:hypothetical protein n=1 Tax=Pontibacter sp. JAM-7 TaxID=3366581 RepID=UPI003AF94576